MNKNLRLIKVRRALFHWVEIAVGDTVSVLTDGSQQLQLLITILITYQVFAAGNVAAMAKQVFDLWSGLQPLIVAVPIFFLWKAFLAAFKVRQQEIARGVWRGRQFIYHDPPVIFTTTWTEGENGTHKEFAVEGAEPDSLVQYRIEVEGPKGRVFSHILPPGHRIDFGGAHGGGGTGSARLGAGKQLCLWCQLLPHTVPAIIRVHMIAWEV